MSINTDKLLFKRLIREYEFLLEDLTDLETVNHDIKDKFMNSLSEIDNEGILETDQMDHLADEWVKGNKEIEELERESNKHPDFKKLFRKVVVKCHPDKLDDNLTSDELEKYKEIYEDSVESNETEDWAKLIRCAIKLEINLPESAYSQIESIRKSIEKLKEKQSAIVNSTAWTWYQTSEEDSKKNILEKHLEFMSMLTKKN